MGHCKMLNHCRYNVAIILFFSALLMGCDQDSNLSLSEQSLIYCSEGSPETFNPQLITSGTTIDATSNQLYNRLFRFQGADNQLTESIAKTWHTTKDGKKITLYLQKGITFHSTEYFTPTRELNADDVLFSFNRIIDEDHPYHYISGGSYGYFQNIEFDKTVERIEKINDYTVRFHLTHSDSSFLANLASDFAVILSKEYGDKLIAENSLPQIDMYPIGTGPFKFKEYRVGSVIRYYQHESYWLGNNNIEQLVYDITPRQTSRLTKLLANECDVIAYPIAHKTISEDPALQLEEVTSLNISYFGFNTSKVPFNNKLVRQAIALAIDKEAILKAVYKSQADIAKSIIPKSSWAYSNEIPVQVYNIALAQEKLNEAGYENGFSMDIWAMPVQRPYNPNAINMAKLIQADLLAINIKVNIVDGYEWNTFLKRLAAGEHDTFLLGWSADPPDPDNLFSPILSCPATKTGSNKALWCNPNYDKAINDARQTTDMTERKAFYLEAMKIIDEEKPLVPIAHSKRYQARTKQIKGDILQSFGGVSFRDVSKLTSKKSDTMHNIENKNMPTVKDKSEVN
mgnify:CR=1 FL=1